MSKPFKTAGFLASSCISSPRKRRRATLHGGRRDVIQQRRAGEHGKEHHATAPYIALRAVDATPELGRHVGRGPRDLVLPVHVEAAAEAQIHHPRLLFEVP